MSNVNRYTLDVDLKRSMTSRTPTFKKGDNTLLYFNVFDDGRELNINGADRAVVNIESPSGRSSKATATFMQLEGRRAVECFLTSAYTLESGIYKLQLSLIGEGDTISFQPFPTVVYDLDDSSCSNESGNIIDLIDDLNRKINDLLLDLSDTIKQSEKGVPNGVASLDENGKIPPEQLPDNFDGMLDHVNQTVYKNQVHGVRILPERDFLTEFSTGGNNWQYANFAKDACGGSGGQILEAQITKSNGVATVSYTGTPTLELQKWDYGERDIPYFSLQGYTFTSNKIPLDRVGLYTLYYKDSNGLEYTRIFNVVQSDLPNPEIEVTVQNGNVEVIISSDTVLKKWAKGNQNIGYFQSQGTIFTSNTFTVDEIGTYTIYYKTTSGAEYVYVFEVTSEQLPNLDVEFIKSVGLITIDNKSVYPITVKKWMKYIQPSISHVRDNGTVIVGNSFEVNEATYYSVYCKFSNGIEKLYYVNFTEEYIPTPEVEVTIQSGNVQAIISESTTIKKWDKGDRDIAYFGTNGTTFTGNLFTVTSTGEYTIYYKTTDGYEYVHKFNVVSRDLPQERFSKTVSNGVVTLINGSDYDMSVKKWEIGSIGSYEYFYNNGNTITGLTFNVTEVGTYSVFVRFSNGRETVSYVPVREEDL